MARIYGYDHIPSQLPRLELKTQVPAEAASSLASIRHVLMDRGYNEIISYSFVAPGLQQLLDPGQKPLPLLNPISQDMSVMRTNLWAGLVEAVLCNQRRQETRTRLFESGLCFLPRNGDCCKNRVWLVCVRRLYPEQWGSKNGRWTFLISKVILRHCSA